MSKSISASPETIAERWKITSGRAASAVCTAAASVMSSVPTSTGKGAAGAFGATTSTSVIASTPGSGSLAKDCASFAPIMPAAPMIRIFMPRLLPFPAS